MQETRNNCFWSKKRNTVFCLTKTGKHECCNITSTYLVMRYSYLPVITWWRMVLHFFFYQEPLLRISCICWFNFIKWSSIVLQNDSLQCFFVVLKTVIWKRAKWCLQRSWKQYKIQLFIQISLTLIQNRWRKDKNDWTFPVQFTNWRMFMWLVMERRKM